MPSNASSQTGDFVFQILDNDISDREDLTENDIVDSEDLTENDIVDSEEIVSVSDEDKYKANAKATLCYYFSTPVTEPQGHCWCMLDSPTPPSWTSWCLAASCSGTRCPGLPGRRW